MSSAAGDWARGSSHSESGKLRTAERPRRASAATSWARAAISGVGKVPSQWRFSLRGSLTSQTHLPPLRSLTPRYTGWRVSLNFFLPARRFSVLPDDDDGDDDEAEMCGGGAASEEKEDDDDESEGEHPESM
ncbi:unnamed protein product [Spirodela intermedia]|uniref:Uncharacterized protein n=1 Tax=Spirodela intermedia TaxID=51605 RepID=A0A7I8L4T5_SPIIN|nr:unnamed protein product [Spirodela intermedia]